MRLNLKRVIVFQQLRSLGADRSLLVGRAPPMERRRRADFAYLSERASLLLTEIKKEAVELTLYARHPGERRPKCPVSLASQAYYFDRIKGCINAMGKRTAEVHQIRYAVLPWQQQAITEVASNAVRVAASTQVAILLLRENRSILFVPECRDHLTTIADSSEDLRDAVGKFLDYDKTRQRFQQLQNELVLAG